MNQYRNIKQRKKSHLPVILEIVELHTHMGPKTSDNRLTVGMERVYRVVFG